MWGTKSGDIVRFILHFQCLSFNRRAKEDGPRQEPVKCCIQREGGLGFVGRGNVLPGKPMTR